VFDRCLERFVILMVGLYLEFGGVVIV